MKLRPARQDDLDLLWHCLAMAAYEPDAAAARAIPIVAGYLIGWQRPSDFGFVAEHDGRPVGAAWARQFSANDEKFYRDARTPELSVAVFPEARGQGVGIALVQAVMAEAAARGLGLMLNARETNPALRLYDRLGFRRAPGWAVRNRTGSLSLGMLLGDKA